VGFTRAQLGIYVPLEPLSTAEWVEAVGVRGDGFLSYVSPAHGGPCAVGYCTRVGRLWAVFPSYQEASFAAEGACRWDIGGYHGVTIEPLNAVALDTGRYEFATDWLFGDIEPTDKEVRSCDVGYVARIAMRDMLRKIAEDPRQLLVMEWLDLERAMFEALCGLGYLVRRTRSTKDGGYDLDVEIEEKRYLVEVKHWSAPNSVGPDAIKRFAEVVFREQASGGLFLSTSGYTNNAATARVEVARAPIMLGDSRKILSFCRSFVLSEGGIWERDRSLTEVFFQDTHLL